MSLDLKALQFASKAHVGQTRKYSGNPYIEHPIAVAIAVDASFWKIEQNNEGKLPECFNFSREEIKAAAYLHDVAEDCETEDLKKIAKTFLEPRGVEFLESYFDRAAITPKPEYKRFDNLAIIQIVFGARVSTLVEQVTDVSKPEDGNRKIRKSLDRGHLAKACSEAQSIKLADLIDNSKSIIKHDPLGFGRLYMEEKTQLIEVLKTGNVDLWVEATNIISQYYLRFPIH